MAWDWMDIEMYKKDVIIIDLGYITDEAARNRADEIIALGVGKRNLVAGPSTGSPRLHICIPSTKRKRIFEALPISDKKTWFGANYSYLA